MQIPNLVEVQTKKYYKLQELKGKENYIFGTYVATEELEYSPAYIIDVGDDEKAIIGTTDLTRKMKGVKIGQKVCIGLKEEVQTKYENPLLIAYVGILEDSAPKSIEEIAD